MKEKRENMKENREKTKNLGEIEVECKIKCKSRKM